MIDDSYLYSGARMSEPHSSCPAHVGVHQSQSTSIAGCELAQSQSTPIDSAAVASISGTASNDPACKGDNQSEQVVADGGRLANVLVYVKDGLASRTFDPPRQALIVKQQGCSYAPHVAAVMSVNLWTSLTMTKRCTTSIPSRRTIRNGTARRCPTPPQSVRRFRTLRS